MDQKAPSTASNITTIHVVSSSSDAASSVAASTSDSSSAAITSAHSESKSPFSEGPNPLYYTTEVKLEEKKEEVKVTEDLIRERANEYYVGKISFDGVERQPTDVTPQAQVTEFKRALDIFIRKKLFSDRAKADLSEGELGQYVEAEKWIISELSSGQIHKLALGYSDSLWTHQDQFVMMPVLFGGRILINYDVNQGFHFYQRSFKPIADNKEVPPRQVGDCNMYMLQSQKLHTATFFLETTGLTTKTITQGLQSTGQVWKESKAQELGQFCYSVAHFPAAVSNEKVTPEKLAALYGDEYKSLSVEQCIQLHEFVSAALPKSDSDRLLKGKIADYIGQRPSEEVLRRFYFERYDQLTAPQKRDFEKLVELTEPKAHTYFEFKALLSKFGYSQVTQDNLSNLYKNKYKLLSEDQRVRLHQLVSLTMPKNESDLILKGKVEEYIGQQPTEEALRKFYFEKYPYLSVSEKKDLNKLVELTDPRNYLEYFDIAAGRGLGFWEKFAIIFGERRNGKWAWVALLALGLAALVASQFTVGLWLLVGGISAVAAALTYFSFIIFKQIPSYQQGHRKQLYYAPEDVPFAVRFQQKFSELHGVWKALTTIFLVSVFLITAFSVAGVLGAFPEFFATLPNLVFNTSAATFAVAGALSMVLVLIAHTLNTWLGSESGGVKNHVLAVGSGDGRKLAWTSASHNLAMISTLSSSSTFSSSAVAISTRSQSEVFSSSSVPQVSMSAASAVDSNAETVSVPPNVPTPT